MTAKAVTACALTLMLWAAMTMPALGDIRREPIHFPLGKSAATIRGMIKGDQEIEYVLGASAGQQVTITLKSSNSSNYFTVMPPGSEATVFDGATSGNTWSGALLKDGEYRLRVSLVDNAADRNETAKYTLDVAIAGARADR